MADSFENDSSSSSSIDPDESLLVSPAPIDRRSAVSSGGVVVGGRRRTAASENGRRRRRRDGGEDDDDDDALFGGAEADDSTFTDYDAGGGASSSSFLLGTPPTAKKSSKFDYLGAMEQLECLAPTPVPADRKRRGGGAARANAAVGPEEKEEEEEEESFAHHPRDLSDGWSSPQASAGGVIHHSREPTTAGPPALPSPPPPPPPPLSPAAEEASSSPPQREDDEEEEGRSGAGAAAADASAPSFAAVEEATTAVAAAADNDGNDGNDDDDNDNDSIDEDCSIRDDDNDHAAAGGGNNAASAFRHPCIREGNPEDEEMELRMGHPVNESYDNDGHHRHRHHRHRQSESRRNPKDGGDADVVVAVDMMANNNGVDLSMEVDRMGTNADERGCYCNDGKGKGGELLEDGCRIDDDVDIMDVVRVEVATASEEKELDREECVHDDAGADNVDDGRPEERSEEGAKRASLGGPNGSLDDSLGEGGTYTVDDVHVDADAGAGLDGEPEEGAKRASPGSLNGSLDDSLREGGTYAVDDVHVDADAGAGLEGANRASPGSLNGSLDDSLGEGGTYAADDVHVDADADAGTGLDDEPEEGAKRASLGSLNGSLDGSLGGGGNCAADDVDVSIDMAMREGRVGGRRRRRGGRGGGRRHPRFCPPLESSLDVSNDSMEKEGAGTSHWDVMDGGDNSDDDSGGGGDDDDNARSGYVDKMRESIASYFSNHSSDSSSTAIRGEEAKGEVGDDSLESSNDPDGRPDDDDSGGGGQSGPPAVEEDDGERMVNLSALGSDATQIDVEETLEYAQQNVVQSVQYQRYESVLGELGDGWRQNSSSGAMAGEEEGTPTRRECDVDAEDDLQGYGGDEFGLEPSFSGGSTSRSVEEDCGLDAIEDMRPSSDALSKSDHRFEGTAMPPDGVDCARAETPTLGKTYQSPPGGDAPLSKADEMQLGLARGTSPARPSPEPEQLEVNSSLEEESAATAVASARGESPTPSPLAAPGGPTCTAVAVARNDSPTHPSPSSSQQLGTDSSLEEESTCTVVAATRGDSPAKPLPTGSPQFEVDSSLEEDLTSNINERVHSDFMPDGSVVAAQGNKIAAVESAHGGLVLGGMPAEDGRPRRSAYELQAKQFCDAVIETSIVGIESRSAFQNATLSSYDEPPAALARTGVYSPLLHHAGLQKDMVFCFEGETKVEVSCPPPAPGEIDLDDIDAAIVCNPKSPQLTMPLNIDNEAPTLAAMTRVLSPISKSSSPHKSCDIPADNQVTANAAENQITAENQSPTILDASSPISGSASSPREQSHTGDIEPNNENEAAEISDEIKNVLGDQDDRNNQHSTHSGASVEPSDTSSNVESVVAKKVSIFQILSQPNQASSDSNLKDSLKANVDEKIEMIETSAIGDIEQPDADKESAADENRSPLMDHVENDNKAAVGIIATSPPTSPPAAGDLVKTPESEGKNRSVDDLSSYEKNHNSTSSAFLERILGAAENRKRKVARDRYSLERKEQILYEEKKERSEISMPVVDEEMADEPRRKLAVNRPRKRIEEDDPYKPFKARPLPATTTERARLPASAGRVPKSAGILPKRKSPVPGENPYISFKARPIPGTESARYATSVLTKRKSSTAFKTHPAQNKSYVKSSAKNAKAPKRLLSGEDASVAKDTSQKKRLQEEAARIKRDSVFKARPLPASTLKRSQGPLVGENLVPSKPVRSGKENSTKAFIPRSSVRAGERALYDAARTERERKQRQNQIDQRKKIIDQTAKEIKDLKKFIR